ncbi:MAG: SDR family oxidoreductase [Acidobacteria bacterium]|nr:MAG: SDR family oxidoreductase [Acidobacteriota bacterium]
MQASDKAECLAPCALAGKTIWITGGGSGLGKAMALRFAALGAKLALSGRRTEPLAGTCEAIEASGGTAAFAPCDVRRSAEVDEAYAKLTATLGPLDALVNNAAGNFLCPAEELSDNAFSAIVDIVLKGTFHCTRTAGRGWIAAKRPGAVLNIVTTYAWTGSAYVMPSAAAKAGVLAMTRSLTVEWARHNIRLNAIAPGPIPTDGAFSRLLPSSDMLKSVEAKIPAGRLGRPEELAELAAFLLSDAAEWIRGEVVTLDGGEWIRRAGSFNDLVDLPPEAWEQLRRAAKR